MIESNSRLCCLLQPRRVANLASSERSGNLLRERFVVSEFVEDRFMEKVLDVFGVVKGGGGSRGLGSFLLVARLSGIDALVDT